MNQVSWGMIIASFHLTHRVRERRLPWIAERTLTQRALNRALLARQLLLERVEATIPRALERICGLQAQYAPSTYVGLWSRLEGFARDDLTRALERRRVIQATLLRVTIHMVSSGDYWPFTEAIRLERRAWWLKAARRMAVERDVVTAVARVRELLADGPRRRDELVQELGIDSTTWNGVGLWLDLVRVPPSGTWDQRSANLYGLAEDWLGPSKATREEGLDLLVRRYLGAFGPASRKDVASFTGLSLTTLAPAIERLSVRRFRDEAGGELLDLPRAPLPDPETPAPVRFLPTWDATLLVHARRTQILPERHRARVFDTKTPHSVATFTVDGHVAGTWREEKGRIKVEAFDRLPRTVRREVDEEADRLRTFVTEQSERRPG
ncbi:MAG: winged helix DNA-binding domain-containing protein [Actinobacteria bacterium]|nr:winged helix DNA-binding domain-containing protein [Actinomycetota bacterium]